MVDGTDVFKNRDIINIEAQDVVLNDPIFLYQILVGMSITRDLLRGDISLA